MKAVIKNEKCSLTSLQISVVELHRNLFSSINANSFFYWQASQPGSSMAQNLMSVAGDEFNCVSAERAATSKALILPLVAPVAAVEPDETEFILPACTVDFSACVAPIVRK